MTGAGGGCCGESNPYGFSAIVIFFIKTIIILDEFVLFFLEFFANSFGVKI